MKKWVKIVIAVTVGLGIVTFSIEPLLIKYMSPPDSFANTQAPPKPDYNNDYYWPASPFKKNPSNLVPPNIDQSKDLADKPVDVFFIHPTGYFGPGGWNSTMENHRSAALAVESMLALIASPFNGCCRIFAPHYREAHFFSFTADDRESGNQALDLAYEDVAHSFEHYIEHENNGRPIIIVGHSQGALLGKRLLQTYFDEKALANQLVAAYIIGYWLQVERIDSDFEQLELCQSPSQTGCIVSYDTYAEGGFKEGSVPIFEKEYWGINDSGESVCINPLTWTHTLEKVEAKHHLGALPFEFLRSRKDIILDQNTGKTYASLEPLIEEVSWAQCQEDGRLEIEIKEGSLFSRFVNQQNKNMHVADFSMF